MLETPAAATGPSLMAKPALTARPESAAAIEAEAAEYPEQRGEILLEAAEEWRRAGDPGRAAELLGEVIAAGGDDACFARCQLAEIRFTEGAAEEAYAELDRLAREPDLHDGHCELVAELLVEREDLTSALLWYDRAVARLTNEQIDKLRGPNGWLATGSTVIRARRVVRRQMGLPPDTMDEIEIEVDSPPLRPPVDLDELRDHLAEGAPPPRQVRMLVFQRAERAEARRRWPQEYEVTDEEYYPAAERRWRNLAEEGVPAMRVVPATVAGLVAFAEQIGGSPTDSNLKARYSESLAEERTISWPPPRNSACWCGSGAKYKKCCGRPG